MLFHLYCTKHYLLKHFSKINNWLPKLLALLWKHPPRCTGTVSRPAYAKAWGLDILWWQECLMCPRVTNVIWELACICAVQARQSSPERFAHQKKSRTSCPRQRCPEVGLNTSHIQKAEMLRRTGLWPARAGGLSQPRPREFYPNVTPASAVSHYI